ncbi:MAG: hypothetical protein AB1349_01245 [Elusimicrobiota bacterium]
MLKIVLLLIISFRFQCGMLFSQEISMEDKMIGYTLKTLAKSYLAATDINKLKKNSIDKLIKIDNVKFQKQYAKVYEDLKNLPEPIKAKYEITAKMTRKQAMRLIARMNKKKLYEIIDAIPHKVIADRVKQSITGKKEEKGSTTKQLKDVWNKAVKELEEK